MTEKSIPPALRRFFPPGKIGGITREDMLAMTEHELAAFASCAPAGLTAVRQPDGTIAFTAVDLVPLPQRLALDIVPRAH
jgi:hypothetical protein